LNPARWRAWLGPPGGHPSLDTRSRVAPALPARWHRLSAPRVPHRPGWSTASAQPLPPVTPARATTHRPGMLSSPLRTPQRELNQNASGKSEAQFPHNPQNAAPGSSSDHFEKNERHPQPGPPQLRCVGRGSFRVQSRACARARRPTLAFAIVRPNPHRSVGQSVGQKKMSSQTITQKQALRSANWRKGCLSN
jgi:hypothetical protein